MNRGSLFGVVAAIATSVACGTSSGPVDPVWGKQACDGCKMIIGDRRFAAELLAENGERRFFDDVGCMAEYLREHGDKGAAWVHAADGWMDARGARYATGARTPMDYGFSVSASGDQDFRDVMRAVQRKREEAAR
ncbi:MAG TPA: hypothetical protein VHC69_29880 [Polyangiaceae bacterium]|nr:hypothetical protein [Polyangiaceae bacterium]